MPLKIIGKSDHPLAEKLATALADEDGVLVFGQILKSENVVFEIDALYASKTHGLVAFDFARDLDMNVLVARSDLINDLVCGRLLGYAELTFGRALLVNPVVVTLINEGDDVPDTLQCCFSDIIGLERVLTHCGGINKRIYEILAEKIVHLGDEPAPKDRKTEKPATMHPGFFAKFVGRRQAGRQSATLGVFGIA